MVGLAVDTDERVVDEWLSAGLDASNPISEGVNASLCGVNLDNGLKGSLATLKFGIPVSARVLAFLNEKGLGVFSSSDHLVDVRRLSDVGLKSWFGYNPTRGEPSGNSSSHLFLIV